MTADDIAAHTPYLSEKASQFVEEFGAYFAQGGSTRMFGRVLGVLLIAPEPGLSSSQLRESLDASKGAISGATRMLSQIGFVERFHVRGSRETFYRVRPGVWSDLIKGRMSAMARVEEMAEKGLGIADLEPEARGRLAEMRDIHTFFKERFAALSEEWEKGSE